MVHFTFETAKYKKLIKKGFYVTKLHLARNGTGSCSSDNSSICNKCFNRKGTGFSTPPYYHWNKPVWWGNYNKQVVYGKLYSVVCDGEKSSTMLDYYDIISKKMINKKWNTPVSSKEEFSFLDTFVQCDGPARKINNKGFIKVHLKINPDLLEKLKECDNFDETIFFKDD